VNIRPVRFGPVRTGRQATISTRASGSPGSARASPNRPGRIGPAFDARYLGAMLAQARAAAARGNLVPQQDERATIQPMSTPFRLDGRKALITGGASGIGEAHLARAGRRRGRVIIADMTGNAPRAGRPSCPAQAPSLSILPMKTKWRHGPFAGIPPWTFW